MAKLTEKQKKEVVSDFASGKTKTWIAKKFGISDTAVSKILKNYKSSKSLEKLDGGTFDKPEQQEIRREIIGKATEALYEKDYDKLSAETLLKIIERLSILEPIEAKEREKQQEKDKTTIIFEFKDTSIKEVENGEDNNTGEV